MAATKFKEGELLVKFKANVAQKTLMKTHAGAGATLLRSYDIVPNLQHVKLPSGMASPTEGVGTAVQRGKLPNSLPVGDTAALVIMTWPDGASAADAKFGVISRTTGVTSAAMQRMDFME